MSDSGPSTPKRSTSKRLTPGRSGRSTPTSQTPLNITPSTAAKYHKALTEYHFQIFTECIDPDTGVVDLEQLQERMMSNATTFTKYSASKLTDINLVISLLDIEYHPTRAEELWLPPEHAVVIPDQFEHVLDCFLTTIQWDVACCEAMARTVIDIVSLPLLRRSVSDLPQSSLPLALDVRIRGGIEIGTRLVTTPGLITGVADYVLGRFQFAKFVGYSVILEAKKIDTYYQAIPQLAAYMVGIAQAREREGFEVGTVYGVLTTGSVWRFLKLNGNNLRQSKSYELVEPREKQIICSFLYEIFSAAISTPLIKKAESHNNVFGTDFSPVL